MRRCKPCSLVVTQLDAFDKSPGDLFIRRQNLGFPPGRDVCITFQGRRLPGMDDGCTPCCGSRHLKRYPFFGELLED